MSFSIVRKLFGRKSTSRSTTHPRPRSVRLEVCALEDRTLMSVAAVSLADPNLLSDTAAGNVIGQPSVSQDGRYVVYTSTAANLAPNQAMDSHSSSNVFLYDRALGTTKLVSHSFGSTDTAAHGSSRNAVISADGNWVAFVSNSDNLIDGATLSNDEYRVTIAGATGGSYSFTYGGNSTSIPYGSDSTVIQSSLAALPGVGAGNVAVSGSSGNFTITFQGDLGAGVSGPLTGSGAGLTGSNRNFVFLGNDNEFLCDQYWVYLYDVSTGANKLISHAAADTGAGFLTRMADGTSGYLAGDAFTLPNLPATHEKSLSISADGQYVAYISSSWHLADGQQPGSPNPLFATSIATANAFVYQRSQDKNFLISHSTTSGSHAFTGGAAGIVISADGGTIAFTGNAQDAGFSGSNDGGIFAPGDFQQVFLARPNAGSWFNATLSLVSHQANSFTRESTAAGSTLGIYDVLPAPVITPDGKWVAYVSQADNLIRLVGGGGYGVQIANVYLYDADPASPTFRQNFLVSHAFGDNQLAGNNNALFDNGTRLPKITPAISDDGRYVAFLSSATNLTSTASAAGANVFLYDHSSTAVTRLTGTSIPLAANPLGPTISGDGRYVGFTGFATGNIGGLTNLNGPNSLDALVYDRSTGTSTLLSRDFASATTTGNGAAVHAVVSRNGSTVLFLSSATNLLPTTVNGHVGRDLNGALLDDGVDLFAYSLNTPSYSGSALAPVGTNATATLIPPAMPTLTANGLSEISPIESVSDDGRFVVFTSSAPNLAPGQVDGNHTVDVFLYDRSTPSGTNPVRLLSKAAGSTATTADGMSTNAVISGDGKTVLFYSFATNLMSGVTVPAGTVQLYLYDNDPASGSYQQLKLVSRTEAGGTTGSNATRPGNPAATGTSTLLYANPATGQGLALPSVSTNGQYVAYLSNATNIVGSAADPLTGTITGATNNFLQPIVITSAAHGLTTGKQVTITGVEGNTAANGTWTVTVLDSNQFRLNGSIGGFSGNYTGGGTWVEVLGQTINVFLYDRGAGTNTLVSHAASGATTLSNGNAAAVAISADGSTVAFYSKATDFLASPITTTGDQLYVWARAAANGMAAGEIRLASHADGSTTTAASFGAASSPWGPLPPSLSNNGAYVAYYFGGNNLVNGQSGTAAAGNVFRYDVAAQTNMLVSRASGSATTAGDNPANTNRYEASGPAISSDGRYIAYANNSTNLLSSPLTGQNGRDNVYLFDAATGSNTLVSHAAGSATTPGANGGTSASISADGRYVSYLDLALDATAHYQCLYVGPATVRKFDRLAAPTAEPTAVGAAFDVTPFLGVGASLAPTVLSADGTTVSWVGLAKGNVSKDFNSNLDVFITVPDAPSNGPSDVTLTVGTPITAGKPVGTTVGILITTDNTPGATTWTYRFVTGTGDTDNSKFRIVNDTIQTNQIFLVTETTYYTVRVETTNNLGQKLEKILTIPVQPSTANPTDITLTFGTPVTAGKPVGTDIGTLTTTDPNVGVTWTYTFVTGTGDTDNSRFKIVDDTIQTNQTFLITTETQYSVRIKTTNSLGRTYEKVFIITIVPSTATPTDITLTFGTPVTSGKPVGTDIGIFTTTDPNVGVSWTYTLVTGTGDTDNSKFRIVGDTLQTNQTFLVTTETQYSVRVRVTNNLGLTYEEIFLVTIQPSTTNPTDLTLTTGTPVTAGKPIGTDVGIFTTTDPNVGVTWTYSFATGTGDTDNARFQIVGDKLRANQIFLVTTATNYNIRVRTTNTLGLFFEKTFVVTIQPSTTNPTDLTLTTGTPVTAGKPIGTDVGIFTTTDPNVGVTWTYTLVAGTGSTDNTRFQIVGDTLKTSQTFLVTIATDFSIRVRTTNTLGLFLEKVFVVTIQPSTANPTDIDLTFGSPVTAGKPVGTGVGTFTTTDPNVGVDWTYTLVTGTGSTDNSKFRIVGDTLQTNQTFLDTTETQYSVRIRVTNNLGLTYEEIFLVTIQPSTANPTDLTLTTGTPVTAGKPIGTDVGIFTTTDPNVGVAWTYSFATGTGDTDNARFQIVGDTLRTNQIFLVTTATDYSIRVRTTNTLGLFFEKTFVVTIQPSTANPTDLTLTTGTPVTAGKPIGTDVGTLTTTDPNVGVTWSYTLVAGTGSTDNARFQIVGDTLKTNQTFLVTSATDFSIRVRTTNTLGLFFEKVFLVTIQPSTTTPTDVDITFAAPVTSGKPVGTAIGTFTTTDPNVGVTWTYTLVTGTGDTDNSKFRIVGDTLQTNQTFLVTTETQYSVRIRVTNNLGLTYEEVFLVTIQPSTANPTDLTLTTGTPVTAGKPVGTDVGTFTTTDPNVGVAWTYTLVAGAGSTDNARFQIFGDTLRTNQTFLVTIATDYSIRVRTTNTLGLFFEKTFLVTIQPSTANPTDLTLSAGSPVTNETPVGTAVGTLTTTDPNVGVTWTYSLVTGTGSTDNAKFRIVGTTLQTNQVFSVTTATDYSLRVRTTNTLGLFFEKVLTVTVLPATTQPKAFSASLAGSLQTDNDGDGFVDPGDTITYTYLVTNSGSGVATNVQVVPQLDPNLQRIAGSARLTPNTALPGSIALDRVFNRVGVFRNGTWYLDNNGSGAYDAGDTATSFGAAGDKPVVGDWNGDGIDDIGVFRNGVWYLDSNGSGTYDAGDATVLFGQAGDIPVVGDWNGDGIDDIGVFRNGIWYLDTNPDRTYGAGDIAAAFGAATDRPVVGDWDGDGRDDIGVFRNGLWYLDANHSFAYDAGDRTANYGQGSSGVNGSGDVPMPGDWNGDGKDEVGVWRQGIWYHDANGSGAYDAGDTSAAFGTATDVPVSGQWAGGTQPLGTISVGDLQPGQTARIDLKARIPYTVPFGTPLTSQALVSAIDGASGLAYVPAIPQHSQVVGQQPMVPSGSALLQVAIQLLEQSQLSQSIRILFRNAGGTPSGPAAVILTIPSNVALVESGTILGWKKLDSTTYRLEVGSLAAQQLGYSDVKLTFDALTPPPVPLGISIAIVPA